MKKLLFTTLIIVAVLAISANCIQAQDLSALNIRIAGRYFITVNYKMDMNAMLINANLNKLYSTPIDRFTVQTNSDKQAHEYVYLFRLDRPMSVERILSALKYWDLRPAKVEELISLFSSSSFTEYSDTYALGSVVKYDDGIFFPVLTYGKHKDHIMRNLGALRFYAETSTDYLIAAVMLK